MKLGFVLISVLVLFGCGGTKEEPQQQVGGKVYEQYCRSCHHAGIAGSPEFRKLSDWEARIDKGREILLTNTFSGITPGMPPKGLCVSCSERELMDAIEYMLPTEKNK